VHEYRLYLKDICNHTDILWSIRKSNGDLASSRIDIRLKWIRKQILSSINRFVWYRSEYTYSHSVFRS